MCYDLNQDETVDDQEHQSGEPDQGKSVEAIKLQKVGRGQPESLYREKTRWSTEVDSFIL